MTQNRLSSCLWLVAASLLLAACSMTKHLPDGEQLYTGLKPTVYGEAPSPVLDETRTEVDAALATAPNGSLFGSSYYRVPFSLGVSIWNRYSDGHSLFAKWMAKTFGKQPVLMSQVNPRLRASVAQNVLRNHGYFNAEVGYEELPQKNPKEAKLRYTVTPGRLYTLDSVGYFGFPAEADSLIRSSLDEALIRRGDPFSVTRLDGERQRISSLLRNNGYYYYRPDLASYLADTFVVDGKVQLRFQLANDVPEQATRKWHIGRISINMRKSFMEQYTDSFSGRFFTIRFAGKKPPVRPRVLLADMKLRPRQLFSYDNYAETASKINAMGLFSSTEFVFTPRPASNPSPLTSYTDTLDLTLNCTFDKPWDFYIETNVNARTIGRVGPELKMGVTRRNAFRGAEKIDVNVHGSYEWATNSGSSMSNYEYGADASVEFPRIIAPFFSNSRQRVRRDSLGRPVRPRRRFYATPSTLAKVATNIIRRPGYYKMHVASGEWTYRWRSSAQSSHEFSPLTVKYQFMNSHTAGFDSVMNANPYLRATMQNHFITQMRYTYTYTSAATTANPIRWETTVAESGNGVALYDVLTGSSWNQKGKTLFRNPYSQFLKLETDFTKTWTLDDAAKLVAHVNAGIIYAYGNSDGLPNSEMFYVGGANSIRAFGVRQLGPGSFPGLDSKAYSYLIQNGDVKLVMNLEYRRRLFGNLHGALFLDAGNVWNLKDEYSSDSMMARYGGTTKARLSSFFREIALGTGIGLRYDLDFLIVRLDWGLGLHLPYDNGRSGYFNARPFFRDQTFHFAIGYPF